ncbi:MAG: hypothetical protein M1823_004119 [Watsoniomyces obsoletus]|nr:MAG: hypothetical protein M1823_004119 [Watsoniomyces obsoletus]
MSERKRKKESHKKDRPHKKVRIEDSPAETSSRLQVSVVPDISCHPVVATSPGLAVPRDLSFQSYQKRRGPEERPPSHTATTTTSSIYRTELLLHSSTHPSIDYLAQEEEADATDGLLKHYVGIYDPQTGKLEVVEARKAVLRGAIRDEEGAEEDETPSAPQTAQALRQELGRTFGSKKARKAIESLTENAINRGPTSESPSKEPNSNTNPVEAALLDSLNLTGSQQQTREQIQAQTDAAKPRPQANLSAERIEDVYPLRTLIGEDILQLLPIHHWQENVAKKLPVIITGSRYVSKRLQKVVKSGDELKLKALRYVLLLLDLLGSLKNAGGGGGKGGKKSNNMGGAKKLPDKEEVRKITGVQDFVLEGIRKRFFDGTMMTKWHHDLLCTTLAAISLCIDNYELDIYDLGEDLKCDAKQMSQYYKELGCKVSAPILAQYKRWGLSSKLEASVHRIAKLTLPLTLPKTRIRGPGGGKRR